MPEAAAQIVFHSAAVTVRSPPSVTILLSGPLVSFGQERRKATSASPWRSSVQPGISLNEIGAGTLHYHVESIEKNTNLRDWVPEWCFPFIFWAANRVGGRVSGRLDWFAGRGLKIAPNTHPGTVGDLTDENGTPLSDHDAISLDFTLDVE